jgi:hypothetical protein
MCTLSIIPLKNGYRVVCNRDESRGRPPATPPAWRALPGAGGLRAVWPTDTQAGGTWIASGEHGLTLALLNLNLEGVHGPSRGAVSRGLVIPALLAQGHAADAIAALRKLDLDRFAAFRLVAIDGGQGRECVVEARWNRAELLVQSHGASPACFASSGLGDELVLPRLELFRTIVVSGGCDARAQDGFHDHVWPDRPEVSVRMSRAEARTVSRTSVTVETDPQLHRGGSGRWRVAMDYHPVQESGEEAATA